jgi:hypothetical protein
VLSRVDHTETLFSSVISQCANFKGEQLEATGVPQRGDLIDHVEYAANGNIASKSDVGQYKYDAMGPETHPIHRRTTASLGHQRRDSQFGECAVPERDGLVDGGESRVLLRGDHGHVGYASERAKRAGVAPRKPENCDVHHTQERDQNANHPLAFLRLITSDIVYTGTRVLHGPEPTRDSTRKPFDGRGDDAPTLRVERDDLHFPETRSVGNGFDVCDARAVE